MPRSSAWDSRSDHYEIPCLLRNPKVLTRCSERLTAGLFLSQWNQSHIPHFFLDDPLQCYNTSLYVLFRFPVEIYIYSMDGTVIKLYRTVIRPIVIYASETWVLKGTVIQKLLVFEREILWRIFGPTMENQIWRVKTDEELDKLIKHKNIINYIKTQRLSWFGHGQRCQIPEQLRRHLIGSL